MPSQGQEQLGRAARSRSRSGQRARQRSPSPRPRRLEETRVLATRVQIEDAIRRMDLEQTAFASETAASSTGVQTGDLGEGVSANHALEIVRLDLESARLDLELAHLRAESNRHLRRLGLSGVRRSSEADSSGGRSHPVGGVQSSEQDRPQ